MIRNGWKATAICFLIAAAIGAWGWMRIPAGAQIPVHFDAMGRADAWGPKWAGFALTPLLILGLGALMTAAAALDPRAENLRRQPQLYLAGWIGVSVLLTAVHGFTTWTAVAAGAGTEAPNIGRVVAALLGALFVVLGNFMGKARPNFMAGVRTPWTLSSNLAWEKTHRFAGRLFVAAGLAGAIWAFAAPMALVFPGVIVMATGPALIAAAYSYFVWRDAPDKRA